MDGAERSAEDTRARLLAAYHQARESGDAELMAAAAVDLPRMLAFGPHPGRIPALIHEAYLAAATPADKCRLAAALARAWVYGGDAGRATAFAREAVAAADQLGDPGITVEVLDAALLAHWGPGDFAERLALSARLSDTAAHLADPAPRLIAYLWRLTTAWECLDVVAVRRQLRALDALAQETGEARHGLFAASRRAMHALVNGDIETADRFIALSVDLGTQADEPDLLAVRHTLTAERARLVGDRETLRQEATEFEAYGAAEGVPSASAEAAELWLAAGEPDQAARLLRQLAGAGLNDVARDVDFLLTVAFLLAVAAALRETEIVADGVRLLTPFAGRAVLNGGALIFRGVVDDYLYRGELALGRPDADRWRHRAMSGYQRVGAAWWLDQLTALAPPTTPLPAPPAGQTSQAGAGARTVHLHPRPNGDPGWLVGTTNSEFALPDLKGLYYIRELLRAPGVEVSALELSAVAPGHAGVTVPEADTAEVADAQALAAYRDRLREIDAELDEAESWSDRGRLDRLHGERDALLDEVRAATGLGGRPRRFASSRERARSAVRKAIAAAFDRIADHDPALARLLRDTIHTGATCRYDPDPARPVLWALDAVDQPQRQSH